MINVIVIGGGASGIMAAITAAREGAKVTILEKGNRLGRKILVSGNGRCNLSNERLSWKNYHGKHPKFAASVFGRFSNYDTLEFFNNLGLATKVEDNGRVFPVSDQAESVLQVLEYELESLGVKTYYKSRVDSIEKKEDVFMVKLFNGKTLLADKVIIATGGKSYSKLGSSGDGFSFAKKFRHTVEPIYPVSVGLEVTREFKRICNKLQGVKIEADVKAMVDDKVIDEEVGTVLFTHFGLSAWAIMKLSFVVSRMINIEDVENVNVVIDFFPNQSFEELDSLVEKLWKNNPKKTLGFSFVGLMQRKIAPALLTNMLIDPVRKVGAVSREDRQKILKAFKSFPFTVNGTRTWDEAQFTHGGVSVEEIDSRTMESKKVPGLFFTGEVVDIIGESGGYNLQWAWSSGYVAGLNVTQ